MLKDEYPDAEGFLEKLQSLEPKQKNRVLVGSTIVIMVGVVYVWLGYFNSIAAGPVVQSVASGTTSSASFSGLGDMWESLKGQFGSLGSAINGSSTYTIQPGTPSGAQNDIQPNQ